MRRSHKNLKVFWYARFEGLADIYDQEGTFIGSKPKYSKPIKASGNISPSGGKVDVSMFGINANYSKVISPLPLGLPIKEGDILWVDSMPVIKNDGTTDTPWDYTISKIATSLNHKALAIRKTEVG